MDGLTWRELILGVLFPLILGGYAYTWVSGRGLWRGIEKLGDNIRLELKELRDNHLTDIIKRIERIERGR